MNIFTTNHQASSSDRRAQRGNTLNLRRFVGGLLAALTGVVMAFSAPNEAYAQCLAIISYQGANAPAPGGSATLTPCLFANEYTNLFTSTNGQEYTVSSSIGTDFLTVTTTANAVIASGTSPVTFNGNGAALRIHAHTNSACGAQSACRTISVSAAGVATPGGCTSTPFGAYGPLSPVCGGGAVSSPGDSYTGEYSNTTLTIGEEYQFSSSIATHWISIISSDGTTVLAEGATPLNWVATAGTVRFATFLSDGCNSSTATHTRSVQCLSGPPASSPCDDAISIANCDANISTTLAAGGGAFSGYFDCTFGSFALNGQEQVYSYIPAESGLYTIQTTSVTIASGFFMNFLVQEGACTAPQGDWTCLLDVSGAAISAPFNMTAGETYYFLVKAESTGGSSTNWSINCPLPSIVNDLCADAEAISCGGSVSGSTAGSTADNAPFCGTSNTAPGVWYVLSDAVAGEQITASLCTGTTYDSKISVFSGSCGALTCVGGNDDGCGAQSVTSWIANGSAYYILVHGFGTETGAFTLNVSCDPPLPIAWCAAATTIGCDASASGTTVGASTTAIPATCGTINGTGGKVAFIYTGIGEDVQANTFGSAFDTKLWVFEYSGACQPGDLVCVGGNDDFGGAQSLVNFFGASGQDYLIVVGGFGAAQGTYSLNVLCGPFGCTDPTACNFDAAANSDDGSCFFTCNDVPAGAIQLSTTNLGTCSVTTGNLNDATTGSGNVGSGVDLWYRFTAATSGVRVEVVGTSFDTVIELRELDGSAMGPGSTEDVTFTNGTEILNFAGLTLGDDYLVRVGAWSSFGSGSRPFDICVQFLPDTQCDYPVGVTTTNRTLCQNAKADWVAGATNYTFHFTPVGGGATITYETGAAFTIAPLQNVPGLLWDTAYEVEIDVALSLTNGLGASEAITVLSSGACELVVTPAPTAALRASDNLANAGPLPLGAFVAATPWVCTATEWEWVFSNTNGSQLPFTHLSGSPGRFIRLADVSGLNAGDVYNVQVRPVFATGYVGAFGATDQIAIIGALGMVDNVTSPVANTEIDERVEATVIEAGVALYPNPNRGDFVNVNIANVAQGVDRVIFDLYDLTGKRVISEQIAVAGSGVNVVMPLNGLADGMYIANIIVGNEVHTKRIVVQK